MVEAPAEEEFRDDFFFFVEGLSDTGGGKKEESRGALSFLLLALSADSLTKVVFCPAEMIRLKEVS